MTSTAPKRSFFSKPSWASTSAPAAKSDEDTIFGRSQIYEDIIAEKKKRKTEQAAKARAREQSEGSESKRRRISDDEDGSDSDLISVTSEESQKENVERAGPVTRSTPTKRKFAAALDSPTKLAVSKPKQPETASILLDYEEDDVKITATTTANKYTKKPLPKERVEDPQSESESEEDEYLRDLKRRARSQVPSLSTRQFPGGPSASKTAETLELSQDSPAAGNVATPKDESPVVKIYITSIYPETSPLIVTQPASKALKRVREIWCKKQGFSDEKTRTFFFTWNGAKLFDSSNLINTLEVLKRQRPHEEDPSGGRIHLEVMNAEIMEYRKKQKGRLEAEEAVWAAQNGEKEAPPEQSQLLPESRCIINLRSENESMRLNVRPTTTVAKIMAGYHKQMKIEEGKTCWLVMDGEKLEPHLMVQDTDIEDGDVVEVIVR